MQVICPTCNTEYVIPAEKIPRRKTVAKCKKCDGRIVLNSASSDSSGLLAAPVIRTSPSPPTPDPRNGASPEFLSLMADLPELQTVRSEKYALREIFTPDRKQRFKHRRNRFKLKTLLAIDKPLNRLLEDGEQVRRIGRGTAYYPAEVFLGNGLLTLIYNHYAIVCTDRRLVFINIDPRAKHPTHYYFQMPYTGIRKVKRGLSSLNLYPVKGKRRTFLHAKGYLSKELQAYIERKKDLTGEADHSFDPFSSLCPACFVPLSKGLSDCPSCGADFKKPKRALLKSLLLPGLGDIYLGHRTLGILELVGSVFVWGIAVSMLFTTGREGLMVASPLLVFYNSLDGLLTYHMAKKGYMLAQP